MSFFQIQKSFYEFKAYLHFTSKEDTASHATV